MTTPHFLLSRAEGDTKEWRTERVVTTQTAAAATRMLREVVTDGTGTKAAIEGYNVAGKTGTAQVALANGGGYAKGLYESSFIGYLPAEDPEVVICVILSAPRRAIYGGAVAAPTFSAIGAFCMEHLKISPSPTPKKKPSAAKKAVAKKAVKQVPAKPGSRPRSGDATGGNSGVTEGDEQGGTH
jgi:cell division protein FtsI/penicillin-binding protein 2